MPYDVWLATDTKIEQVGTHCECALADWQPGTLLAWQRHDAHGYGVGQTPKLQL